MIFIFNIDFCVLNFNIFLPHKINIYTMKTYQITSTIIQIIKGYENQLANAEIKNETANIKWLKEQINEGHKMIAQFGTYGN